MARYTSQFDAEDIDRRLGDVDLKIGAEYLDVRTSPMRLLGFLNEKDREDWINGGDDSLIKSICPLEFTGTQRRVSVINKMPSKDLYFAKNADSAIITVGFLSQEKGITDAEYTEVIEDFKVSVFVDRGFTGEWMKIIDEQTVINGNDFSVDVFKYLITGNNRVRITVTGDLSETTGSLVFSVNLTSMFLTASNFNWNVPFIEGNVYELGGMIIAGEIDKNLNIIITNNNDYKKVYKVELGDKTYDKTPYIFKGLEFPTDGTGVYSVDIWLDGGTITSDHLKYDIICIAEADVSTAQLMTIRPISDKVINGTDNVLFEYVIYNGASETSNPYIELTVNVNNDTVTLVSEELVNIPTKKINKYETKIEIDSASDTLILNTKFSIGDKDYFIDFDVDNSASYPASSENLVFYLNPSLRNNSQVNREKIINSVDNSEVNAVWKKIVFEDGIDGHTVDEEGRKCLFIPAHSKVEISYYPFKIVGNAKTIEFTFKARNVADYNEPIITVCDDVNSVNFKGIVVKPTKVIVHSNDLKTSDLTQSITIKEEKTVHVIITIIKNYNNYGNLAQVYINGTKARSFEFENSDSWLNNGKIILGSDTSDLYIYNFKVFDRGFDKLSSEQNFVASLRLSSDKANMYNLIHAVRDGGDIDYNLCVKAGYNTMVIEMLNDTRLPQYGLSKDYSAYCNVEFSFINLPIEYKVKAWAFILYNCLIQGQGTTSMNYYVWNLRFRLDKSGNLVIVYPNDEEVVIY